MDDQSGFRDSPRGGSPPVHWLRLSLAPGIGRAQRRALLEHCGDARTLGEALTRADKSALPGAGALTEALNHPSIDARLCEVLSWRAAHPAHHVLALDDPTYPPYLRTIDDPPPVLYVRGVMASLDKPMVAIVGTRKASRHGIEFTRTLAGELAESQLGVVSGLAYGIDAAAHSGCLEAGGSTVAVMATPLDRVYPPAHAPLAERIADSGALISEVPFGSRLHPGCFPRRNRLVSGLAWGVVVVEAALPSGSLITARHALDQGREVMAVPGMAGHASKRGCHALLRDGAALVESARDVLEIFASTPVCRLRTAAPPAQEHAPAVACTQVQARQTRLINDPDARTLLNCLELDCATIDTLAERTGWPVGRVCAGITLLEIEGLVLLEASGLYTRR